MNLLQWNKAIDRIRIYESRNQIANFHILENYEKLKSCICQEEAVMVKMDQVFEVEFHSTVG